MFPPPATILSIIGLSQQHLLPAGESILPPRLKRLLIFLFSLPILSVRPNRLKNSSRKAHKTLFRSAGPLLPTLIGLKRSSKARRTQSNAAFVASIALKAWRKMHINTPTANVRSIRLSAGKAKFLTETAGEIRSLSSAQAFRA